MKPVLGGRKTLKAGSLEGKRSLACEEENEQPRTAARAVFFFFAAWTAVVRGLKVC
jgi:hypothetical protein